MDCQIFMSCNVMKMIDDHDSFVTFHLVHVDKCFVNNCYLTKRRNNKVPNVEKGKSTLDLSSLPTISISIYSVLVLCRT